MNRQKPTDCNIEQNQVDGTKSHSVLNQMQVQVAFWRERKDLFFFFYSTPVLYTHICSHAFLHTEEVNLYNKTTTSYYNNYYHHHHSIEQYNAFTMMSGPLCYIEKKQEKKNKKKKKEKKNLSLFKVLFYSCTSNYLFILSIASILFFRSLMCEYCIFSPIVQRN